MGKVEEVTHKFSKKIKMIFNFINTRRLKRDIQKLEENIILLLANDFPEMADNYLHWTFSTAGQLADKTIYILHQSTDNLYYEFSRAKHRKHFFLTGIEVLNKLTGTYIPIRLKISNHLIQNISLPLDKTLRTEYDLSQLRITNLHKEDFTLKNTDEIKLNKILSDICKEQKNLLEIEDTIEIELDEKYYYTIIDVEDGNYIAVNKKGNVFRLMHDHEEQAKKIFQNVQKFMEAYSGDKYGLQKYFEQ